MKKIFSLLISCVLVAFLVACSTEEKYNASPKENLRALWKILDEGYCFFDEKLPEGKTWQMVYDEYEPLVSEDMTPDELFDVLERFVAELKDGHVNIFTNFDVSHYNNWRYDYPENIDNRVRRLYLGKYFRTAGSAYYTKITYNDHAQDSIGYIVYGSFLSSLTNANINAMFSRLKECKGLIIDCRSNGGGNLLTADLFAGHFCDKKTLVGYMSYKTGPGHHDFSDPKEIFIEPTGIKWLRPVVLLTNRGMYSAANSFAMYMKEMPYVTLLGDFTGGGAGLPRGSELPNGWRVRYSSSIMTDARKNNVEFGVEPDINISLNKEDVENNKDTLIEEAIRVILRSYSRATNEEAFHFSQPIE